MNEYIKILRKFQTYPLSVLNNDKDTKNLWLPSIKVLNY